MTTADTELQQAIKLLEVTFPTTEYYFSLELNIDRFPSKAIETSWRSYIACPVDKTKSIGWSNKHLSPLAAATEAVNKKKF